MKIISLEISKPFKYLWLKSVHDVDLNQHCARCLIGNYDERVSPLKYHIENIDLKDHVYYLCGVSEPYKWSDNFHLAFIKDENSKIDVNYNGVHVVIEGGKQLPISAKYEKHPKMMYKSYSTCRNWQFANYFLTHLK